MKDFVGAPAGATASLRIKQGGSVLTSAHKGDGETISGVFKAGTYTIDEVAGAEGDVDLGLYASSVVCTDGQSVVASDTNGWQRPSTSQTAMRSPARSRTTASPS